MGDQAAVLENAQKYENYKEQFKRLDKAIANGFYLEAIFISYAILEDRASSILRYEGNSVKPQYENGYVSIERKIKKIQKIAEQRGSMPKKYFSDDLLTRVLDWKEKRNTVIHRLLKEALTTEDLEHLAIDGRVVARQFTNRANNYKRAVERQIVKKEGARNGI